MKKKDTFTLNRRERDMISSALNARWWELYRRRSIGMMTVQELAEIDAAMAEVEAVRKRMDAHTSPKQ